MVSGICITGSLPLFLTNAGAHIHGDGHLDNETGLTETEIAYIRENPSITATNEFDWPPFDFAVAGRPMGFGVDLMRLLAEKAGLKIEFVNGYTWDELVELFFSGKIDLIHSLSETPERTKKVLFSTPYYHSKNVFIYRRDSTGVDTLEDLEGKIISLPKGWSSIEFFKTYFPRVQVVEVDNTRQALEYVDQNKVFATVEQEGIAGYFIKKFGFSDLKMSGRIDNDQLQKSSSMHYAVLKTNPVLFGILEKSLAAVTAAEMDIFEKKWFGRPGMKIGRADVGLAPEERQFLKQKKMIRFSVASDRMPFESIENNQVVGMTADFLALLQKKIDVPFTLVPTQSWRQSIAYVETGKSDMLTMIGKAAGKNQMFDFTIPYLNYNITIVVKQETPFIGDLSDLYRKKVGIIDADVRNDLQDIYPHVYFIPMENARNCLVELSSGRLDAVLLSLPVASYYIRSLGLSNLKIGGHTKINQDIRVGVKKENQVLHSIMSKLVRSVPKTEIDAIYRKWVVLEFEHGFDYSLLWKVLPIALTILAAIVFWNRKLVRLNREIAVVNRKLKEKSHELEKISITDPLTNIFNRRHLEASLEDEVQRTIRYGHPLSVILIDIDYFKSINDDFGHQTGDRVLSKFTRLVKKRIRKTDILGRWGGEEFLIVCPEISIDDAFRLAEGLRKKIETTVFDRAGKRTASFGIAEYKSGDDKEALVVRADMALYRAKESGRNQVRVIK